MGRQMLFKSWPIPGLSKLLASEEKRVAWATRSLSLALVVQIIISFPAWVSGWRAFPLVPAIPELPVRLGAIGDGFLLFILISALLYQVWQPTNRKVGLLVVLAGILFVLEDINRLQPWFYLYLMVFALLIAISGEKASQLRLYILQLMLAGTWFWSGFMKLNPSFEVEFFSLLVRPFGLENFALEHAGLAYVCGGLEAFAGFGMLLPRLRKAALAIGLGLHIFILGSLGPFGLNWNPVVWPWNVAFMLLGILLFAGRKEVVAKETLRKPLLWLAALLFVLLPALNLVGAWDHFLSGSFYSGRLPDGVFYYEQADRPNIPVSARPYVLLIEDSSEDLIPLEFWSLGEMRTPGYPEIRTKKQVGAQLCACLQFPEKAGLRITRKLRWATEQEVITFPCVTLVAAHRK
ncbi:MAG TPA: hypothetical protein ENJ82_00865 [Bacteroidetes bacterium]|nr:hypothetical protein [Bacteroidota bacterium]